MDKDVVFHKVIVAMLVVLPFIGLLVAIALLWQRYVFMSDLVLLLVIYVLTTMGVTIGYHRMLTHRSFQAPDWLRAIFVILGAMSYDGQPISWVATHIDHHAHSDKEGDPHSPLDGFWHAHIGWLFSPDNFSDPKKYAPHLLKDDLIVSINRLTPFWLMLSLVIPFLLGGWTGLIWGGAVRILLTNHITWSVNSVCHTFGKREFETEDASHNHWLIGLLGFGEGWHNNHHAFPSSAFHGLRWWQFDMSALIILGLEKIGLVWDVKRVSAAVMDKKKDQAQQLQRSLYELRDKVVLASQNTRDELIALQERLPALKPFCEFYLERLTAIGTNVVKKNNLRQQKLNEYLSDVRKTSTCAKQLFQTLEPKVY